MSGSIEPGTIVLFRNWMNGIVFLGPIAALGGLVLALALGRLAFWWRHFSRRDPGQRSQVRRPDLGAGFRLPPSGDPLAEIELAGRLSSERAQFLATRLLVSSRRRLVLLDTLASLAALVGLLGTFVAIRTGAAAPAPARLTWAFGPALAGLSVFVFARAAVALFHAWDAELRLDVGFALQASLGALRADSRPEGADPISSRPQVRAFRPWKPAAREDLSWSLKGGAAFAACLIGSVVFHSLIFYAARHLGTFSGASPAGESDGLFQASLVALRKEPESPPAAKVEPAPPAPEAPSVVPPPPPPPPPPVPEEPAAPNPPKPEPPPEPRPASSEAPSPAQESRPSPAKEEPKPAAPAESAPPPPAAASAPERAPASETAAAPAPKVKETLPAPTGPAEPAPSVEAPPKLSHEKTSPPPGSRPKDAHPPAPQAATEEPPAAPSPASGVLGFGSREGASAAAGSGTAAASGEISTLGDYRRFLAGAMTTGPAEGQYVPHLRFADNQPQENREIMRYFGMELIAYPKDQKFYVYIDPEQGLYSKSSDFSYIRNFSSRVIFRTSPYFDALRTEAARRTGVDAGALVLAQLLKPSSAAYIGWKERECARRAGLKLEEVDACDARFVKTPFGIWIVRIEGMLLKDGRTVAVRDFEWAKVTTAKGEDP